MLYGQIETELAEVETWFLWQQTKLPHHLQRLVEQEQGRRDIWEWESRHLHYSHIRQRYEMKSSESRYRR